MKRIVLAVLLTFIAAHAPWRLAVLATEAMFLQPGYVHTSAEHTRYWDALNLAQTLNDLGWRVEYVKKIVYNGNEALGLTMPENRHVFIDETQSWNARYATLAHEGGHTLQPTGMTENQAEVFAEAVACIVTNDGIREHARYLARFKGDALVTLLAYWPEIYRAAAILEAR